MDIMAPERARGSKEVYVEEERLQDLNLDLLKFFRIVNHIEVSSWRKMTILRH